MIPQGQLARALRTLAIYYVLGICVTCATITLRCIFPLGPRVRMSATIAYQLPLAWPVAVPMSWPPMPTRATCYDYCGQTECRFDDADPFGYAVLDTRSEEHTSELQSRGL